MRRRLKMDGTAWRDGDQVEVYLRLKNGEYVKLTGDARQTRRHFGRFTRPPAASAYGE